MEQATALYGGAATGPRRWRDLWSAGHSVSGVHGVEPVAQIVERVATEYAAARAAVGG